MFPLGIAKIKGVNLLDYVEGVAKSDIGLMKADQQKTDKANQYHQKTPWGLLQAPKSKVVQSFLVTVEDMSYQEN